MKFTLNQRELVSALTIVSKATNFKTTMEILKGIHIEAKKDYLIMKSHDLSLSIIMEVPAFVEREGKVLLDSSLFNDIIRKLPDQSITMEVSGDSMEILCDQSKYRLSIMDEENYPQIPRIDEGKIIKIRQDDFSELVKMTNFAVGQDETRPILTGSLVQVEGKTMKMVSVDGFTIAIKTVDIIEGEDCSVVIPGKNLNEIQKIISSGDESMDILIGTNHVVFYFDGITIISKILEGSFINYERVTDTGFDTEIEIPTREFYQALDRVALLANRSRSYIVNFEFGERSVDISNNSTLGLAKETVAINNKGENIKISFNPNYLLRAIRALDDDSLVFALGGPHKPGKITKRDSDDYEYYVVPVRTAQ